MCTRFRFAAFEGNESEPNSLVFFMHSRESLNKSWIRWFWRQGKRTEFLASFMRYWESLHKIRIRCFWRQRKLTEFSAVFYAFSRKSGQELDSLNLRATEFVGIFLCILEKAYTRIVFPAFDDSKDKLGRNTEWRANYVCMYWKLCCNLLVLQSANWQLYRKAWHFWGYTYSERFDIRALFVLFTVT